MEIEEFIATRVQRGEVVILKPKSSMSMEEYRRIGEQLRDIIATSDVQFIMLTHDMDVVGIQEAPECR